MPSYLFIKISKGVKEEKFAKGFLAKRGTSLTGKMLKGCQQIDSVHSITLRQHPALAICGQLLLTPGCISQCGQNYTSFRISFKKLIKLTFLKKISI
jgi:hypothetical protein